MNGHGGYRLRGKASVRAEGLQDESELRTDHNRWRLLDERGRQRWFYLKTKKEAEEWPQTTADRFHLGMPLDLPKTPPAETPLEVVEKGLSFFERLQLPPGNWACEYGGPLFLLPGIVITWYVTGYRIPDEFRIEISNYLFSRQREDGGWGLHIEGQSTVFGTVMNYTTLRLLGQDSEDPRMVRARIQLHSMGGALNGPHWAKFWLSVLGVCEWGAVNPVPAELWLIPDSIPIAPWRWWCHMRQVFLPMSYLYSQRYSHPPTPLTRSLRAELYTRAYPSINFPSHRNDIHPRDNHHPKTTLLHVINWLLLHILLPLSLLFPSLKQRAQDWTYQLIQWEDENSDFACLGPVNAPMNTVACFVREGPDSYPVRRHHDRLHDFLWMSKDGLLANGTNGVQTWDTALAIQAVVHAGVAELPRWKPMLTRALAFLADQQFPADPRCMRESYRHPRRGAWGFSNRDQGYTVSDCTAEALKSVMLLQSLPGFPQLVPDDRVKSAVDILLTLQNRSGGFASYEPTRGSPALMEQLNAAEVFGRIMVEYDYPECSTAATTALSLFSELHPSHRRGEIDRTISSAAGYIRAAQRPDGSWYGSWGICFSYAGMFALEALAAAGETYTNAERVRRACRFFLDRQNPDGGWGESYRSCEQGVWIPHEAGSQVVQTAWVLIALMEAGFPDEGPLRSGLRLLVGRQRATGEWGQEGIEGVFNKTCMISYPNYKFYFPVRAVGMYGLRSGDAAFKFGEDA